LARAVKIKILSTIKLSNNAIALPLASAKVVLISAADHRRK
jgi:hypothetical protein